MGLSPSKAACTSDTAKGYPKPKIVSKEKGVEETIELELVQSNETKMVMVLTRPV